MDTWFAFNLLATVDNAATNLCVQKSVQHSVLVLLDIYPEVELLNHTVILFLSFWGTTILFSRTAAPFYIPTNSAQVYQFLHVLTNTYYFLFLW